MTDEKTRKNAHLWMRHPDDWYVEPDWCNDALFAKIGFQGLVVDPCCGFGRILDAAARAGLPTLGCDIADRGARSRHDFKLADFFGQKRRVPNIACNPPYKYDDRFVAEAVARSERLTAVLLRAQWANGGARSRWLESLPLRWVLALSPRPSMPPGTVLEAGISPGSGTTDYSWFVFERGYSGAPSFGWARRAKPKPLLGTLL